MGGKEGGEGGGKGGGEGGEEEKRSGVEREGRRGDEEEGRGENVYKEEGGMREWREIMRGRRTKRG